MAGERTGAATGGPERPSSTDGFARWEIEITSTALMALATVLSAWSAYQAARWSGVQTMRFSQATAARMESVRAENTANQSLLVDVMMFGQYAGALSEGNARLASFLKARFRPELGAAVDAWLARRPLEDPDAPPSPFAMPEYSPEERAAPGRLLGLAEENVAAAKAANQRSDNYILLTVLFASVLFFAGLSSKLRARRVQVATVAFGALILLGSAAVLATFPVH